MDIIRTGNGSRGEHRLKRSTLFRIIQTIRAVSNNVTVVENKNKALIVIKVPEMVGESPQQKKAVRKLLAYASYFRIVPDSGALVLTLEFEIKA